MDSVELLDFSLFCQNGLSIRPQSLAFFSGLFDSGVISFVLDDREEQLRT